MSWENILKEPEMEPPMEEPPMEEPPMMPPPMGEPMVDPMTGLPIDPNAAPIAEPPAHPNPTGEKEFPVDPEVEDDNDLNKWFSTIKKAPVAGQSMTQEQYNAQFQTNPANQARIDRKKKEAADKLLAQQQQATATATATASKVPPQLQNVVIPRPNQGRVADDAQARANAKKNRELNPNLLSQAGNLSSNVAGKMPTIEGAKKIARTVTDKVRNIPSKISQTGKKTIAGSARAANSAYGATKTGARAAIDSTKPVREGALDLLTEKQKGRYGSTITGAPKKEGSRNLALGQVPRKVLQAGGNVASKEKGKWQDALRESQAKVRDSSSEAGEVADLQRRSEFFRQQKLQQQAEGEYEGGPIEYTNTDGSKEVVDRGGASTEFGDFADAKGGSIRDPKTGKLLSEKGLSEMQVLANKLNIDWEQYNSNPKYKEIMSKKISRLGGKSSRVDAYSNYLSGKQKRRDIKPVEATAEQSRDRYETEIDTANRERREAKERQKLADEDAAELRLERQKKKVLKNMVEDKYANDMVYAMDTSVQKQDRRDDPTLWESWDGGLVD